MTLEQCDSCLHYMKEYQYWHRCPNCGATKEKSANYTCHPVDLHPHQDQVRVWSHPLEWLIRRPRLLLTLWVASAGVIMAYAIYVFIMFFMDPTLVGIGV